MRSIPACAGEPAESFDNCLVAAVYPRLRGGTVTGFCLWDVYQGLSPLARGNLSAIAAERGISGSIPACAGEPYWRSLPAGLVGVYPRLRGGTCTSCCTAPACAGLSPLARGNPQAQHQASQAQRSIPACAGEPLESAPAQKRWWVYPRLRGGTRAIRAISCSSCGLSPLARGNLGEGGRAWVDGGSIPACAGEPAPHRQSQSGAGVYPRLRGGTWLS